MISAKNFLVLALFSLTFSVASAADYKGCRYSKASGGDIWDNTRVAAACASNICAAVVVCDNQTSVSNVVCASTPEGCPSADQCMKEHKANGIKFGAFASTPYKEVAKPTFPDDSGGGAR
ncbi:MAG: hypothetical protein KF767_13840 [Bdellovibrionaceae bacterium]|jgi:hypothetical protein|nr:hypothetical protein [Pseudobdellovibrionaceae bacterium]